MRRSPRSFWKASAWVVNTSPIRSGSETSHTGIQPKRILTTSPCSRTQASMKRTFSVWKRSRWPFQSEGAGGPVHAIGGVAAWASRVVVIVLASSRW